VTVKNSVVLNDRINGIFAILVTPAAIGIVNTGVAFLFTTTVLAIVGATPTSTDTLVIPILFAG
jgi:hypothetical protein